MSSIPLPQRGQPIDYNYLYTIIDTINNISNSSNSTSFLSNVFVKENTSNYGSSTSDVSIDAGYVEIYPSPTDVSATKTQTAKYTFRAPFKFAPIVTVSPIVIKDGSANHDAIIVIDSVTQTEVSFTVKFPTTSTQKASIGANIIAVGIPNK